MVLKMKKYVVCYSGGHSSALVAIEAVRKCGRENVILLNHDISPEVEHSDIKRFKQEIANCLGLEITYANMPEWENLTPLRLSMKISAFSDGRGQAFCTNRLKTEPFHKWLEENYPATFATPGEEIVILYGFDKNEPARIQRRGQLLCARGYKTEFPLAYWTRTIFDVEEIGIKKPETYKLWKHANCQGCLKAGRQHWYCVYCLRPDIWAEAKEAERIIGYSIIKGTFLEELEPKFSEMKNIRGICPSEKVNPQSFWANLKKVLPEQISLFPCECAM